jgi:hypothetical protein
MLVMLVVAGVLGMGTGTRADPQVRTFLMLGDDSFDVVAGQFVPARWPAVRRWDEGRKIPIYTIDGLEFPIDRKFWRMIEETDAKFDARPDIKLGADGGVIFRGKGVDLKIRLRHLNRALHWNGWVVGLATIVGDARRPDEPESTIKGGVWYVVWFSEKTLKGSHWRTPHSGTAPTLRIYAR